jgi:hypothetical protein
MDTPNLRMALANWLSLWMFIVYPKPSSKSTSRSLKQEPNRLAPGTVAVPQRTIKKVYTVFEGGLNNSMVDQDLVEIKPDGDAQLARNRLINRANTVETRPGLASTLPWRPELTPVKHQSLCYQSLIRLYCGWDRYLRYGFEYPMLRSLSVMSKDFE